MYMAVSILIKLLGPTPLAQWNTTIHELASHLVLYSDLSMYHVQILARFVCRFQHALCADFSTSYV